MTTHPKTKTKIVSTIGPKSSDLNTLKKMLENGMNVARFNMSHDSQTIQAEKIKLTREASKKTKKPVAILLDLSGPKIRVGDFSTEYVDLVSGESFTLTTTKCQGDSKKVYVNYSHLTKVVKPGTYIYLDDGKLKLHINKVTDDEIETTIIVGGKITGRRGVNIPDADLPIPSLTAKDRKDAKFGVEQDVDFMTLSFVRTADDIHKLRKLLGNNSSIAIVAKIETRQAIENLESIVETSDVLMVARGDLAIETPLERVPLLQKKIIRIANHYGKPVITATHMLNSMRTATNPTRAEVADIANAILDGTDALMLSEETAIGEHPERAVEIMSQVAYGIEQDDYYKNYHRPWDFSIENICDSITQSIASSVKNTGAKLIVALSESGHTPRMIARHRPDAPIVALTPDRHTYNQLLIVFGCEPRLVKGVKNLNEAIKLAKNVLQNHQTINKGDVFILGAGIPFEVAGSTNTILIDRL